MCWSSTNISCQRLAWSQSSRRFLDGLGFALFVFVLLSGNGGVVFEPLTPAGNCDGLGMVQKAIQNRARRGHIAQKFSPLLQWPVTGHDGGPVFIPAHNHFEEMLAGVSRQLFRSKLTDVQCEIADDRFRLRG